MSKIAILMYHSLYEGERELADIPAAERPYAVSIDVFERQLDALERHGLVVGDPARMSTGMEGGSRVIITFDDGHASNYVHALPALSRRSLRAAFFVTTDFVGARTGFCTWPMLRELSNLGMTIGTHGATHRFLDDMPQEEALRELLISKDRAEHYLGQTVNQLSFPGGRFRRSLIWPAVEMGYCFFHSSRVGVHRPTDFHSGAVLSRLAVRRTTRQAEFLAMAQSLRGVLLREQLRAGGKAAMRRAVGNRIYHSLYERLST